MRLGLFGKLQSKRDFIAHETPREFLTAWEPWLQASLSTSRLILGDGWRDAFLTAPIWRFWLGEQVCGATTIGALMPSMDGVGRYFPLVALASFPGDVTPPPPEVDPCDGWFEAVERCLLDTLDGRPSFEQTLDAVAALPAPPLVARRPDGVQAATAGFRDFFAGARGRDPAGANAGQTFWWTCGGQSYPPSALAARGLPNPQDFASLLTGPAHRPGATGWERIMTAAGALAFETGAVTHVGKVRSENEDNYLVRPDIGLWAVADGMGGHEAGGLASAAVVASLQNTPPPASAADLLRSFQARMAEANATIRAIAQARSFGAIGTTIVALLAHGRHFACLWAGDSRLYRLRDGGIVPLTRDHSEVQDLVDRGVLSQEDARTWPGRNVITRAVGVQEEIGLELRHGEIAVGDAFLLCSDGLTAHVRDEEIPPLVDALPAQAACVALVALTLERGATDNVTTVFVRCGEGERTIVRPAGGSAPGSGELP